MPSSVQPAVSEASCPEWPEHPFSGFLKQVFLKHSRSDSGRASPANIRHAVSTRRCRGSRTLACTLHASSTPVQGRHSENPFSGRSPEAGFPGGVSALPFRFGSGFSCQLISAMRSVRAGAGAAERWPVCYRTVTNLVRTQATVQVLDAQNTIWRGCRSAEVTTPSI